MTRRIPPRPAQVRERTQPVKLPQADCTRRTAHAGAHGVHPVTGRPVCWLCHPPDGKVRKVAP